MSEDLSAVGSNLPGADFDKRTFSCTIWTDNSYMFSFIELEFCFFKKLFITE